MVMRAKVLRLRQMGVLQEGSKPPEEGWPSGVLETTNSGFDGPATVRRLILRDSMCCPGKGLLMELYRPELIRVQPPYLRLRGIEAVPCATGQVAGVVQEWLVLVLSNW